MPGLTDRELRDRDLLRAYQDVVHRLGDDALYMSRADLIELVVREPAPRCYVSAEHVLRLVREYRRCGEPFFDRFRRDEVRARARHLVGLVERRTNGGRVNVDMAWWAVLEPAPSFFLSAATARRIV